MTTLLTKPMLLHESATAQVWRGQTKGGQAAILKLAQTSQAAESLRYEMSMLQRAHTKAAAWVPQPLELLQSGGITGILSQDTGATALSVLYASTPCPLPEAVHIALQVAQALEAIHQARIAHKDITPENLLYNPSTRQVQVIDFGIATYLPSEAQHIDNLRTLEGTPAFLSPEQTGRTHGSLNYRTDFYSLGVCMFWLLAGRLPFEQVDTAELVYSILTARAPNLCELRPAIPTILGRLVERLMQKDPDKRYQSAHGIAVDLQHCAQALAQGADIPDFTLGQQDRIERPIIPHKLYGRDAAVAQLSHDFETCPTLGQAKMVMLHGPPGIGKSSLMLALQPAIMRQHGLYLAGKHDHLRRHIPFSAFNQALSALVRHILMEPAEVREAWERRLRSALGNIGQALIDIAPDLELLLGKQKPVPTLGPRETENRLLTLVHRFVAAVSSKQPLVLFLDDLQWADPATLRLLQLLATTPQQGAGLLIVGAYRNNEVDATSPLQITLDAVAEHAPLDSLQVGGLAAADVQQIIADTLPGAAMSTISLAQLIWQKSDGNPYFIHELVRHLWDHELISYAGNHFIFDLSRIVAAPIAPTMVELVTQRLRALSPADLETLSIAACIGDVFDLRLLTQVQPCTPKEASVRLDGALQAGLIIPVGSSYRYAAEGVHDARYRFVHDRVRQAAYDLMPAARAQTHHLAIARTLLAASTEDAFTPLEHFRAALPLLVAPEEMHTVAHLAMRGALEAKRATAYSIARQYLAMAQQLFPADLRTRDFATYRSIAMESAESEFLDGDPQSGLAKLDAFLPQCQSQNETAQVHALRATIFDSLGQGHRALDACAEGLHAVGFGFDFNKAYNVPRLLGEIMWRSRGDRPQQLLTAPDCADAHAQVAMTLLGSIAATAYYTNPTVYRNVCLYLAALSIRHGSTRESAFAYAVLSAILCTLNRYAMASKYALVAQDLLLRRECSRQAGTLFIIVGWSGFLENGPAEQAAMSRRAMTEGLESSDVFTRFAINLVVTSTMASSLPRGEAEADSLRPVFQHLFYRPLDLVVMRQYARCLQGKTDGPLSLNDPEFNAQAFTKLQKDGTPGEMLVLLSRHMYSRQLHGDYQGAFASFKQMVAMHVFAIGTEGTTVAFSFYGIALLTELARREGRTQTGYAKLRGQMLNKLRHLSDAGPAQWRGVYLLARAEITSLKKGQRFAAAQLYDQACIALEASPWKERRALAHDRAGRFCISAGMLSAGRAHLQRACEIYADWGAVVKADMLRREVKGSSQTAASQIATSTTPATPRRSDPTAANTGTPVAGLLQVFQGIGSEVVEGALTKKILHATTQISGATRSVLLLGEPQALRMVVDTAEPPEALPQDLLSFVARSKKSLVMHDLLNPEVNDAYLGATSAQAVVCLPILYQGQLNGVLYAENSLSSQAFPPEQVTILEILASQAGTALQNARLYGSMETEVAKRTQEVKETHTRLLQAERENTETQMAGGFAHEMRNALSAARMALEAVYPFPGVPPGTTVFESMGTDLTNVANLVEQEAIPEATRVPLREQLTLMRDNRQLLGDLVEPVLAGVERGLAITRETLDYASVGQVVPGDDDVRAKNIANTIVDELSARMQARRITARITIEESVALPMKEEHAYAILRNLLANATDALQYKDGGDRQILVSSQISHTGVVVTVEDTGSGMSASTQREVFKPFFTTKGVDGTGLGLGLSRKLARAYGGDLTFVSNEGAGTTFSLTLPRRGGQP